LLNNSLYNKAIIDDQPVELAIHHHAVIVLIRRRAMSNKENRTNEGKIQIVSKQGNIIQFPSATNTVQFGSVLKDARTRQKLSQEEIANLMGVTRYTIMNWESNKNKPDYGMVPRLCSILGITLTELFGMRSEYTAFERSVISELRLLKPTTQRFAASMIKSMADQELAAHDEMLLNTTRIIDEQPGALAAGTAASGIDFLDAQPTPFFIHISDKTKNADAVVRVSGHSMEPDYRPDDVVFFEYTNSANVGEDVVVCWGGKAFIKRLASDGTLYSVNKQYPFIYEGDGSDIQILGRVLGILGHDDLPSESDLVSLRELFHDELVAYDREHGIEY